MVDSSLKNVPGIQETSSTNDARKTQYLIIPYTIETNMTFILYHKPQPHTTGIVLEI